MKSVLISIQPKWVEKIASGEKTIEVRKTRPKLETPFKCYIYCTNDRKVFLDSDCNNKFWTEKNYGGEHYYNGKVIGEFVCDKIYKIDADSVDWIYIAENYCKYFYEAKDLNCCLSDGELYSYSKGLCLQGWHITDLKIYDKPKELGEFSSYTLEYTVKDGSKYGRVLVNPIKRPPQSWCYIESLGE